MSALLVCLLVLAAGAGWRLSGGGWAVIESPSMGRYAPVGTLIFTRPAAVRDVHLGEVVTYRPAATPKRLYTHRVVAKNPNGDLQVRGDINGASDPLPVRDQDLYGKVVAALPGLGWLVRALPPLLLGVVVLLIGTGAYVPVRWRSTTRILGICLLICLTSLILRPFVHPFLIAVTAQPHGETVASVVSGGLFPTRITGTTGRHLDLVAGQTGTVPVTAATPGRPAMVTAGPHLTGGWIAGVTAISLLPLLWSLLVGLTPDPEDGADNGIDADASTNDAGFDFDTLTATGSQRP